MASLGASLRRFFVNLWNPPWFQSVTFVFESLHLTRAYYVAAELGLADLIQQRPRDITELAGDTATDPKALHRIMRTLAAFRVFAEDRRGRFRMTRRARVLLSDGRASLRWWLVIMGRKEIWQGYAETLESVKTGVPAFQLAHGVTLYEYLATHPEMAATFAKAMSSWTEWQCTEIARAYDFSRFDTVVDVGGGMGSLLQHLLERHPHMQGTLLDHQGTLELAKPRFAAAGFTDRCEFVAGSFLESVPAGADAYLLKHILRDWEDDRATAILENCAEAMGPDATLLVIEAVVDPRNGADRIVKLVDMEGGSLLPGRLRTLDELNALFEAAGFRLVKVHSVAVPDCQVVEAQKTRQRVATDSAASRTDPAHATRVPQPELQTVASRN